jgi:hypothetical protein
MRPFGKLSISEGDGRVGMLGAPGWDQADADLVFFDVPKEQSELRGHALGFSEFGF